MIASVRSSWLCPLLIAFDSLNPLCLSRPQTCPLETTFQSQGMFALTSRLSAGHGLSQPSGEKPRHAVPFLLHPSLLQQDHPLSTNLGRRASPSSHQISLEVSDQNTPAPTGWISSSKASEYEIKPGPRLGTVISVGAGAPRPWHRLPSGTGDISHLCSSCKNVLFSFSAPIVCTTATNDPFLSII